MSRRQPDPDRLAVWRAFLDAHASITQTLEHELLAERELPLAWYEVLLHLSEAGGRLRMAELSERLLVNKSSLSRLCDRHGGSRSSFGGSGAGGRPRCVRRAHEAGPGGAAPSGADPPARGATTTSRAYLTDTDVTRAPARLRQAAERPVHAERRGPYHGGCGVHRVEVVVCVPVARRDPDRAQRLGDARRGATGRSGRSPSSTAAGRRGWRPAPSASSSAARAWSSRCGTCCGCDPRWPASRPAAWPRLTAAGRAAARRHAQVTRRRAGA